MNNEKKKGGRKPKIETKSRIITIRLDVQEEAELDRLVKDSGAKTRSEFIKSTIFTRVIKTVVINKEARDYYIELNNLQCQYRKFGNNYNQVVKLLHSAFNEKKALAFLAKLEKTTIDLILTNKKIIELTKQFLEKW